MAQAETCESVYRERGRRFRCERPAGHEGDHNGWSVGRRRDWTDEDAEAAGGSMSSSGEGTNDGR